MRQYPFCDKTSVNFGIQLDAENSIWMQSRFDGFDFFATLVADVVWFVDRLGGSGSNSATLLIHQLNQREINYVSVPISQLSLKARPNT